ncbi:hypothetical protein M569_02246 [Genlisea aurea]|uniref:Uncharacterized protein n=1 Tax=Genlisea aurea TaxID=192259 RepID=S8EIU4_9LAMI|nr:hypothetical protein M569_02246 [Genlisea aurea]
MTFCKLDLTNVSPDGVLLTHSGGKLSFRTSSGYRQSLRIQEAPLEYRRRSRNSRIT